MELSQEQVTQFQEQILTWYQANKRDLPWRRTRDPYAILVSEVMLQQTQVSRVIPKYEAWMKRFPTVKELAEAPLRDVLQYWSGLGYNRRALNLQRAARTLVANYQGTFPTTVKELEILPGIGKYTAAAVACFAFDQQIAVVDTNVRKVILVEFGQVLCHCEESKTTRPHTMGSPLVGKQSHRRDCFAMLAMTEKEIEEVATQLVPQGYAYEWNQALMDYSSLILKKEKILPRSGILLRKTKQSRFHGSDRYYRGQTLKLLLTRHTVSLPVLQGVFQKKYPIASERLEKILEDMVKDGFLLRKKDEYCLANQ